LTALSLHVLVYLAIGLDKFSNFPSFSKSGPPIIFAKVFPYILPVIPNPALCTKEITQSENPTTIFCDLCIWEVCRRSAYAIAYPSDNFQTYIIIKSLQPSFMFHQI